MKFKRHIYPRLEEWRSKSSRKPLILRGARQVGKTTLIDEFGQTFKNYIRLNLERTDDLEYFEKFDDVKTIRDALFLSFNISSTEQENTLLFIDEIQESPKAISLLRYFYEDIPELPVIAAGSLLEHVMNKVKSIPVGRVEYLYIHPLNFAEYIEAQGHEGAANALNKIPVEDHADPILTELFHEYAIIGGMPEIIKTFIQTKSLTDLPQVYESIWATYKDDVEKYAQNDTYKRVINHLLNTAHLYIDQRIKFQNFGNSNYKSREVGESFRDLADAKIIQLLYPTTDITPPVKPDLKKSPRMQFLDTGIVNYELNIQANMLTMDDLNTAYKGAIIPHLVFQEVISLNTIKYKLPNFWVREKSQASSEVDLVIQYCDMLIPIEIKSGKEGKLKSLHQFIERVDHPYAIRMYAGRFSVEQHNTPGNKKPYLLMNIPYYLGTKLPEYINHFIDKYKLDIT